jgi:O-antigen/teichoic acid export membrane protein
VVARGARPGRHRAPARQGAPVSTEAPPRASDDGREETPLERVDRNTIELLNELRVAGTGIQVLLAFLLVAPFDSRFTRLSVFERDDYFLTLVCIAISAVLLIAPSVHHRILFRQRQKPYILRLGNQAMIVAMMFLGVGLTGILVLISDLIFGGTAAVVAGVVAGVAIAGLWFAVPLKRRLDESGPRSLHRPRSG